MPPPPPPPPRRPVGIETTRDNLVFRIKNDSFLAFMKENGAETVTQPLVGDLHIAFAFDLPNMFAMATPESIAKCGVPREQLLDVAIDNVRSQVQQIGTEEHPPLYRIVTGNNLEACILVANKYWDDLRGQLGAVIATVPDRDTVLFCDGKNREAVDILRLVSGDIFDNGERHALSRNILQYTSAGWRVCGKY